jgi:ubiquinone/menaquinone biosynthesis C-methylase UbiE
VQLLVDGHFAQRACRWKEIYDLDDIYAVIHQDRLNCLLTLARRLPVPPGSPVLDVGCGAGRTAIAMAAGGYRVQAVDTVEAMVAATSQLAAERNLQAYVKPSVGDAHDLHFGGEIFSVVVGMGVIPYLHSPLRALREMARVLKPGGYCIVSADNRWRLNYCLDPLCFPPLAPVRWKLRSALQRLGLLPPQQEFRALAYSRRQFDSFLQEAGLQKISGITLGFGPFTLFRCRFLSRRGEVQLHRRLQAFAERGTPVIRFGGTQYIVVAQKRALAVEA